MSSPLSRTLLLLGTVCVCGCAAKPPAPKPPAPAASAAPSPAAKSARVAHHTRKLPVPPVPPAEAGAAPPLSDVQKAALFQSFSEQEAAQGSNCPCLNAAAQSVPPAAAPQSAPQPAAPGTP